MPKNTNKPPALPLSGERLGPFGLVGRFIIRQEILLVLKARKYDLLPSRGVNQTLIQPSFRSVNLAIFRANLRNSKIQTSHAIALVMQIPIQSSDPVI